MVTYNITLDYAAASNMTLTPHVVFGLGLPTGNVITLTVLSLTIKLVSFYLSGVTTTKWKSPL